MPKPVQYLETGLAARSVCFHTLLAGQSHVFSSHQHQVLRAPFLRQLRDAAWRRLNLTSSDQPLQRHEVLVCAKNPAHALVHASSDWPLICKDVRTEAARLGLVSDDQIKCIDPAVLPLADQVAAAAQATAASFVPAWLVPVDAQHHKRTDQRVRLL